MVSARSGRVLEVQVARCASSIALLILLERVASGEFDDSHDDALAVVVGNEHCTCDANAGALSSGGAAASQQFRPCSESGCDHSCRGLNDGECFYTETT